MPKIDAPGKHGTQKQFDKAFEPVAIEIGHFARAWNGLHEELGTIFSTIIDVSRASVPLAIWYSIPDDGLKRRMLRAATGAWFPPKEMDGSLKDEIAWLLKRSDLLAERRNDALHAPIHVLMRMDDFTFSVEPNYFWGNPRATKLKGKDMRAEFAGYRRETDVLRNYAFKIWMHMRSRVPLPGRPAELNPAPQSTRTRPSRLKPTT